MAYDPCLTQQSIQIRFLKFPDPTQNPSEAEFNKPCSAMVRVCKLKIPRQLFFYQSPWPGVLCGQCRGLGRGDFPVLGA